MSHIPEDIMRAAEAALCDGPEFMLPEHGVNDAALLAAITRALLTEREASSAKVGAERDELQKALTGLAGGGSELFNRDGDRFSADIPVCVEKVRARHETMHRLLVAMKARATAAEAARDEAVAAHRTIVERTGRCDHDGGFDREIGPIGCLLGDGCICIGVYPVSRAIVAKYGEGE